MHKAQSVASRVGGFLKLAWFLSNCGMIKKRENIVSFKLKSEKSMLFAKGPTFESKHLIFVVSVFYIFIFQ